MDELLTTDEAAALLGVHRTTIDRYVDRGILPVIQVVPGSPRRFRRADVEALMSPQAKTS